MSAIKVGDLVCYNDSHDKLKHYCYVTQIGTGTHYSTKVHGHWDITKERAKIKFKQFIEYKNTERIGAFMPLNRVFKVDTKINWKKRMSQ